MKRSIFLITICLSVFLYQLVFANQPLNESVLKNPSPALKKANSGAKVRLSKTYGNLPLAFEANEGQTDEQVKFLSRGSGYSMFLTPTETVLSLSKDDRATAIRMGLVGANPKPKMAGEEKLPGKNNYLIGNDPKKWRTNVSNYKKVRYEEVYPGIDLVYYGNQRKLEYDFIVKPGVDPKAIRMQFAGVERMSVEAGDLVMHTASGDVTQKAPIIYQEIGGKRKTVAGNYMFLANHQVGFYLNDYDTTQPLVIDPILEYSTYLGGSGFENVASNPIAIDDSGNAYVAGWTNSTDFPTTTGVFQSSNAGNFDIFVTKLDASGQNLIYSTYIGGSAEDRARGLAVDSNGNAVLACEINSGNFPLKNAFQGTKLSAWDAAVTKLNSTGDDLIFSTFLGSNADDAGYEVAIDGSDNIYVSGFAVGSNFPKINSFQPPIAGGGGDAFVTKFNSAGGVVYSSVFGGSGGEVGDSITVDSNGNAYVAGRTHSSNLPTVNAFQPGFGGGSGDGFIAKINPTGNTMIYLTYLGGNSVDEAFAVEVDSNGNAYVTGNTHSLNFPIKNAFQPALDAGGGDPNANHDAFLTKLNPSGNGLIFSTYFGGSAGDSAQGLAVDSEGQASISGSTVSKNLPLKNPLQGQGVPGSPDPFVDGYIATFSATGDSLVFSTYLASSSSDRIQRIVVDGNGNIYAHGHTDSSNFPTTLNAFQNFNAGSFDMVIVKISGFNNPPIADAGNDQIVEQQSPAGANVILNGSGSSDPDGDPLTYAWTGPFGTATGEFPNVLIPPGVNIITLIVNDGTEDSAPDTVEITVTLVPEVQLPILIDLVGSLNLPNGTTNSLLAKLNAALNNLNDGNPNNDQGVINNLQAFINAVQAQSGKKISVADANALITSAQAIIDLLNGA